MSGSTRLTVAAAAAFAVVLCLSSGAGATDGLAVLAGGEKLALEAPLSMSAGAIRGVASASGPLGVRLLVVSGSYFGETPEQAPIGGYVGTTLLAAYDAQSLVLLWENTTLAVPSVSAPLTVDRDGDGVDEILLWASGRLLWFDLSGRLLADIVLENESNPVARTPSPMPIYEGSGPPDLLVAGRHGNLMRVSISGTVRWSLSLSNRSLVGDLITAGRDPGGNATAYVSDGSSNPSFGAGGSWTALAGRSVFFVDTSHGILINSIEVPGGFPPVRGALYRPDPAANGIPDLMAANGSGTVFRVTLTSTARGMVVYAEIPIGAATGFDAMAVCPEAAWGRASFFEHVGNAIYGFDSVGRVWNRTVDYGGLVVGLNFPQRDSCTLATAVSQNLTLFHSAFGADAGTLALPSAFTARTAEAMDLDGDGWSEVVVLGRNASTMAPSMVVLALAPLLITPTGPSMGAQMDVWAGGNSWTDVNGGLSGLPSPLPFDTVSFSIGLAGGRTTPSWSLGNATFRNATEADALWVDGANSSVAGSGGSLSFSIGLSAGWTYGGNEAGPLTVILTGPNRPAAFVDATVWVRVHWAVESARAPRLSSNGTAINHGAWVSPSSRLSFDWGPLRYANTSRLLSPAAFNWFFGATTNASSNLTTDPEGRVLANWQFAATGPGTEDASIRVTAQLNGGPAYRYDAALRIDRVAPEYGGVSPDANNTMWFSSTRLVIGSRICDNESGIEAAGIEIRVDGSPVGATVVASQRVGGCLALLMALDASGGEHVAELLIWDRAGNAGAAPPRIPLRIDLQGLQFSQCWPTDWTSAADVAVGCQIDDVGGSGINLGELQWATASSPAGPFVFTPVAASGAALTYALREVVPAAAEGFLFVQFSGRDLAGNNRSFSPIILVRIDRTAPQLAGIEGIDGQVRTTPALWLNVSVMDGLSGLDLDASWVRWESESSNASLRLSSGQVIWVDQGASAFVLLSLSTPFGWSTITLTILDRAGNALTSGPHRAYLNAAPRLTVHGIANGSTVGAGVDVMVAVDVEDADGSPWSLSSAVDGVPRPDGAPIVLNVAPGYHTLVVTVTDSFGLRDSISIEFYAETQTSPTGGWFEPAAILVILATASAIAFVALRRTGRRPA